MERKGANCLWLKGLEDIHGKVNERCGESGRIAGSGLLSRRKQHSEGKKETILC